MTIYFRPLCNAARYSKEIERGIVSKVGNKYFEIEGRSKQRFHIDTLLQDGRGYSPDWRGYLSMKVIQDEDERNSLIIYMREIFSHWGKVELSLEQLRAMKGIVENSSL
jgi:hypothetical protein